MRHVVPNALQLVLLSCIALLSFGCDDTRSICSQADDCAAFCEQLGLPVEGAACSGGQCTCLEPVDATADVDPVDVGNDTTAADSSTTTEPSDTATADTTATDTAPTDPDSGDIPTAQDTDTNEDTAVDTDTAPPRCPPDMVDRGAFCIDRWEAPNFEGALPLVMYTFDEAAAWCAARSKRLCFDDEWTSTCEGAAGTAYPYGDTHQPGVCNDAKTWMVYNQALLSQWPFGLPTAQIDSLSALLQTARAIGPGAAASADHVESIYQAEPAGSLTGCSNEHQVFDLTGNVEEWTRRRDGGQPDFHGNLKGRYWAETRTCQSNILSHGDGFRFYEIGFRCCRDIE